MITEHIENAYLMLTDAITEIEAFVKDAKPTTEDGETNLNKMDWFLTELKKMMKDMDSTFLEITG